MTYKDIPGWYDFESAYEEAVKHFQCGTFVEVGCYLGRSLCHLGQLVKDSHKAIRVVGVDHCLGSGMENGWNNHASELQANGGTLAGRLHRNVLACEVSEVVDILVAPSVRGATYFADKSVEFVFIDAAHDHDSVVNDIVTWLPKIKDGGWIGGDDFGGPHEVHPVWPGVRSAVKQMFSSWEPWSHDSWRVRV